MDIPQGPFFIPKYNITPSGVDFLGMRQANLNLMDICLPGINNYVRYLRGFSVLSWIYWKFHALMKDQENDEISSDTLIRFKEKAEILFTWGHKGLGLPKVPGIEANPPDTPNGKVELSFGAWHRAADNTSLMAAPTYGPASKTTGGLGFLDPVKKNVFRASGNGVHLAEALDKVLGKSLGYDFLVDLEKFTADEATAKELFPFWDVRSPSDEEKAAFAASFYDRKTIGSTSAVGRRSNTMALVLQVLKESHDPLTENEIRIALAYRRLKNKPLMLLEPPLEVAWLRWFIMQIRQAHRLAMESLLAWIENRLISDDDRDTIGLVSAAIDDLDNSEDIVPQGKNPTDIIENMFPGMDSIEKYLDLADTNSEYCIFFLMDEILKSIKEESGNIVPLAIRLLFLCSKLSTLLQHVDGGGKLLNMGGPERISLKHWHTVLERFNDRTMKDLIRFIVENLVLSQHYGVAAFRFDGKKQRLRISVEENGLEALIKKPLKPFVGEDRLAIALCLMAECGLITDLTEDSSHGTYVSASR